MNINKKSFDDLLCLLHFKIGLVPYTQTPLKATLMCTYSFQMLKTANLMLHIYLKFQVVKPDFPLDSPG